MKKVLFVLLAMALLGGTVQAQSDFKSKVESATGPKFYFGPKFGFNITSISNSGYDKSKFSFLAGGFAEFRFNREFSFLAELLYARQGDADKHKDTKYRVRVNYLNIPLMAKYYVWQGLSVNFGPQIGFALNARSVTKNDGSTVKVKVRNLNTLDFGFGLGVSYDFDWGLVVSTRYNLGLTNVFDKDDVGNNKSRSFQLTAGWRF